MAVNSLPLREQNDSCVKERGEERTKAIVRQEQKVNKESEQGRSQLANADDYLVLLFFNRIAWEVSEKIDIGHQVSRFWGF